MKFFCECNSFDCVEQIEISSDDVLEALGNKHVILSNDCEIGPEPKDTLVEKKENYTMYKENYNE